MAPLLARSFFVVCRTAMDYPAAVERLVIMDGLPVIEHLERLNEAFVRTWWHWWFMGQTDKPAEAFISAEDYRAGLRTDRAHEEADRTAGRKIGCPVLLLVSSHDDLDIHGDPETIWRPWVAGELRSRPIHSGHHQAEQAPDELASALQQFLR